MDLEKLMREKGPSVALCSGRCMLTWDALTWDWIVTHGVGRSPKSILYKGSDLEEAVSILLTNKKQTSG